MFDVIHTYALVATAICVSTAVARGAEAQASRLPLDARHLTIGAQLGFYSGQPEAASNLHVFVPQLSAQYAFDERFSVAVDFGVIAIASVPDSGPAETLLRLGNPGLLAMWRGQGKKRRVRLGIGWAPPVASIGDDGDGRLQRAAFNHAQAMNGLADAWLWAPYRTAGMGYAQIELDLGKQFALSGELAPAVLVPVFEDAGKDDVSVFIPASIGLSARIHEDDLVAGARLQLVVMPANALDGAQFALVPWLRAQLGGGFFELRFTANVGEPIAGSRGPGTWGLHLLGGATL
jgi:hypothetical protein